MLDNLENAIISQNTRHLMLFTCRELGNLKQTSAHSE